MDLAKLETELVTRITSGAFSVPPFPEIAIKLRSLMDAEADLVQISNVVYADGAIVATLLRRANSGEFLGKEPVSTVRQALLRLGTRDLLGIVLASTVGAGLQKAGVLATLRFRIWRDSLIAAMTSRHLASLRGVDGEEAFTAALLHDLGKIIAVAVLEDLLATHPDVQEQEEKTWMKLIAQHNTPIGLVVARRWRLPEAIANAIDSTHRDDPLSRIVRLVYEVSTIMSAKGVVDESDLSPVQFVSQRERDSVWALLETVPQLVAAFINAPKHRASSLVASQTIPKAEDLLDVAADLHFGTEVERCNMIRLTSKGIIVETKVPPVDSALVKISILNDPPFFLWGQIQGHSVVSKAPLRFAVEIHPFGRKGDLLEAWARLRRS